MKHLTFGIAIAALALAGCGKKDEAGEAAKSEAPAVAQASESTSGVPECDEYLTKVMACVNDKIPEAQRAAVKQGIDASKAGWAAVTDKAALAKTCKMAMDQAKAAYSAMGCSF